ncbi:MAG: hypothetical protein RI513_04190 [Balneolaceae bacterium]|nr:hypothetical protein [Balneolaceae bacterium]MDR9446884.1 hypothetical protein [Balneolaceae bacterium]
MKNWLYFIALTWFFTLFLPWWSLLLSGLIIGLWRQPSWAFPVGLSVGFIVWTGQSVITAAQNNFILSERLSVLFAGMETPWVSLVMAGLVGGLLTASSAWFGKELRVRIAS